MCELDELRAEAARLRNEAADLRRRLADAERETAARFTGTDGQRRRFVAVVWQAFLGRDPAAPDVDYLARQVAEIGAIAYVSELAATPEATVRRVGQRHSGTEEERRIFVRILWQALLGREPGVMEADHLAARVLAIEPIAYARELANTAEAQARRADAATRPALFVPPGHFYSPIVDPASLPAPPDPDTLPGVDMDWDGMSARFDELARLGADLRFPDVPTEGWRYHARNAMFGPGDAAVLACMVRRFRPRHVIEVGSGFSSAALLDTLDRTPGLHTACTFIEPDPARLRALLRAGDDSRSTVIDRPVQDVPLALFDQLADGDILFLDTTHVSKTGSDVNHEVFAILPRLKRGVVVHFHDVFHGFEYPDDWVHDENRSWNEQYVLRALLMDNRAFTVLHANHGFCVREPGRVSAAFPGVSTDPGVGLWLQKVAEPS